MLAAADGAPALSLATMALLCRRLAGSEEDAPTLALSDEFVASPSILAQGKVRSLAAFCTGKTGDTFTVFTSLANNAVEEYHLKRTSKEVAHTRSAFLALPGHRKPIRCGEEGRWSPRRPLIFFLPLADTLDAPGSHQCRAIALSHDETVVLTTSNSTAKLWNWCAAKKSKGQPCGLLGPSSSPFFPSFNCPPTPSSLPFPHQANGPLPADARGRLRALRLLCAWQPPRAHWHARRPPPPL